MIPIGYALQGGKNKTCLSFERGKGISYGRPRMKFDETLARGAGILRQRVWDAFVFKTNPGVYILSVYILTQLSRVKKRCTIKHRHVETNGWVPSLKGGQQNHVGHRVFL